MAVTLKAINPLEDPSWDQAVLAHGGQSFFLSSCWARVLHESYGYQPMYFTLVNGHGILAALPLMEIQSRLTGRRGVSLPFSDYCDPLLSGDAHWRQIIDHVTAYGRQARWRFIELRGGQDVLKDVAPYVHFYGHTLDLAQSEGQIFSKFRDSTRRNIRKAEKEGVKVTVCSLLESMQVFYELNCMTRKIHGLPPQPYSFFRKIHEHIIAKGYGIAILASYHQRPIAGAIYFHSGSNAIYKYGASDRAYRQLRANNLVMWEAIKWYSQNKYASLCLGRTEPNNLGLRQFKVGWGVEERVIRYFRYDLRLGAFVQSAQQGAGLHNKLFSRMPVVLLRAIGSLLYRHIG